MLKYFIAVVTWLRNIKGFLRLVCLKCPRRGQGSPTDACHPSYTSSTQDCAAEKALSNLLWAWRLDMGPKWPTYFLNLKFNAVLLLMCRQAQFYHPIIKFKKNENIFGWPLFLFVGCPPSLKSSSELIFWSKVALAMLYIGCLRAQTTTRKFGRGAAKKPRVEQAFQPP